MNWKLRAFVVVCAAANASCAQMPVQQIKQGINYKYDLKMTVDGVTAFGFLVAKNIPIHQFEIESEGDLDMFTQDSCHEHKDTKNAHEDWWIPNSKKKLKFKYIQSPPIETSQQCPVILTAITEDDGQNQWGFVDFEDDRTTLPATIHCNGDDPLQANGVSVCQSKFGTYQQIDFTDRVDVSDDPSTPNCALPQSSDKKIYRFPLAKGFCTYVFGSIVEKPLRKYHRFTTYGFEQILLHGSN